MQACLNLSTKSIKQNIAAQNTPFQQNTNIAKLFTQTNLNGTFVVYDSEKNLLVGHNKKRAEKRFVPGSTYKIAHSLIGLDTGAVSSVDEVFFKYDGSPLYLKSWERDMSLRDAIKVSNVPAYKTLARRIGLEKMQSHISKLNFGNKNIGPIVDEFWLNGPLKISAIDQAFFLLKLAHGQHPYPKDIQMAVRNIALLESSKTKLYGKTGLYSDVDARIGWFVGWVEKDGRIYPFALNMEMDKNTALSKRIDLAKESLAALGIL